MNSTYIFDGGKLKKMKPKNKKKRKKSFKHKKLENLPEPKINANKLDNNRINQNEEKNNKISYLDDILSDNFLIEFFN
tara:strand:+ start:141 stop:374 length:234 start_codon:yes stop_codon:yes gene_type:complete